MIFEFLTGGLPLGLATVIGLTYLSLKIVERSWHAVILCAASYLLAAATTAALKIVGIVTVFGSTAVQALAQSATQRVNGELDPRFGERTLLNEILRNMDAFAPGMESLSIGVLFVSLAAGAWGLARQSHRPEVTLLAASNVPILLWPLVFQQHTLIHAAFMNRIFVWTIAAGFALFVLGVVHRRASLPLPSITCPEPVA